MNSLIINNNFVIRLANDGDLEPIKKFFSLYLSEDNQAIYNAEFLCPFGLKYAVIRKNVIIAISGDTIVGALRFYTSKRNKTTSLYQFAISPDSRKIGLLKSMLSLFKNMVFIVKCPKDISFNNYYLKTGWSYVGSEVNLNVYSILS